MKAQKKKMSENQRTDPATSQEEETSAAAPDTSLLAGSESEELSSGPRQRLHPQVSPVVASSGANVSVVPPTVNRATIRTNPSDIPRQSRGAMRLGSLVLIWLLLLVIGALVVRRIYIMAN